VPGNICTPTAAKDALYCGASPLVLYAFDKEDNKLWEVRPEGDLPLYEGLSDWANTLDYPSIGDDGTLYVGSFPYPGITSADGKGRYPLRRAGGRHHIRLQVKDAGGGAARSGL